MIDEDETRWSDKKFKHRRYERTHQVTHWKDGVACSVEDAERMVLEIHHGFYTQRLEFDMPADRSKLAEVERMLGLAFEEGRRDKAEEVRRVLNVTEPRS